MVEIIFQRGFALRESLVTLNKGQPLPGSLYILPVTPQIKGLHTFIRNKETARDEFVFYSQRLMRLVIEYALSLLPFKVNIWCGEKIIQVKFCRFFFFLP